MTCAATGRVAVIAGPTASGKTRAGLNLAARWRGASGAEIVNADAMQLYRDIPVLSAQPTPEERGDVPHHLFGVVDAATPCSAGAWARRAAPILKRVVADGGLAILVGGSGLYLRAAVEGLSAAPRIPEAVREAARARLGEVGLPAFRAETLDLDPAMARLDPNDAQRHLRAWEVATASGTPLSTLQAQNGPPAAPRVDARIVIEPDRDALYAACDARFDAMLAGGALDEVGRLASRGLDADLPAMKALGVAELAAHLRGESDLHTAVALAKRNTRRFAKRQLTWFRNQTNDWPRATSPETAAERLAKELA